MTETRPERSTPSGAGRDEGEIDAPRDAGGDDAGTPGAAPVELLEVGFVARAHGLRGQVVVELVSNRPERVTAGATLVGPGGRSLEVVASTASPGAGGRDRWIVAFAGVEDRAQADELRGSSLRAEPVVDPEVLWVHELIGATVADRSGALLGTVTAVESNPASDLLVLEGGALVPLHFVTSHAAGRVVVDVPDGLFDL